MITDESGGPLWVRRDGKGGFMEFLEKQRAREADLAADRTWKGSRGGSGLRGGLEKEMEAAEDKSSEIEEGSVDVFLAYMINEARFEASGFDVEVFSTASEALEANPYSNDPWYSQIF
ncbi:hypothetical protein K3495_g7402 [Podosphaera aphanis]|nr:hypothetical protein K3495_g7402 [Podosphaera aphanis]